jgi:hypothetical protein
MRLGLALAFVFNLCACSGSPDSGLSQDGSVELEGGDVLSDAGSDATDAQIAPTCATIDASCLGETKVPYGWSLIDISADAGSTCPGDGTDFDTHPLVANPRLRGDSCTCAGCTTSGAWSCDGKATINGGTSGTCTAQSSQFPGTAQCVAMSENAGLGCLLFQSATVSATPPAPSGTPTCTAAGTGTQTADTDKALGCRPSTCASDYCGMRAKGFQTCIVHDGDTSGVCPAGFHAAFGSSALAAPPGNVTVGCDACGCTVDKPGACTANVRVFAAGNASSCDGDGGTNGLDFKETLAADGTCKNTGICAYDGLYYAPNPPPPTTCAPTTPTQGTGHTGLVSPSTVCCAP